MRGSCSVRSGTFLGCHFKGSTLAQSMPSARRSSRYSTRVVRMPPNCSRYGEICILATAPSGRIPISPLVRRTKGMLHTGQDDGHAECTPGHIGQKNSVVEETEGSEP